LLAECERAGQPFAGMVVLMDLVGESLASGDLRGAAGWLWRQLMVAADRERSEPLATLVGVTALASIVMRTGALDEAVRLRESVRSLESLLQYCVPPPVAAAYERGYARLIELVPADRYASLAAQVAESSLHDANRRAQKVARMVAELAPPEASAGKQQRGGDPLTPRERDVLLALASGGTNREIADQLGLSVKTVMHHSVAIYRKLDVRGRAAATAWAYRQGLVRRPSAGGE
jgi:DNA-binding CsgD family transcriptional regulator